MDIRQYISSGIIESYVMGLCTPEEMLEMESLRTQYPELEEAVLQYEAEWEANLLKNPVMPGVDIDEKVLGSLRGMQAKVVDINVGQPTIRRMNWWKPVAAAAVLLLSISAYFNYSLYKKSAAQQLALKEKENYSAFPQADYAILKSPSIIPIAMNGVGIHSICRCTMFWDKSTGKVYVMVHHLAPTGSNKNYQLWAMVNDKPVSVGLVNDKVRGRFSEIQNMPASATKFIVTLEKAGGNTEPTLSETYLSGSI
jgi:Anti-sigma-K factor rskA